MHKLAERTSLICNLRVIGRSKNGSSPSYWLGYMATLNFIYPTVFFIFGNGLNTLIGVVYLTINDGKSRTKYMPVIPMTNMIALNLCLLNQYDFVLDLQAFFILKYKCLIIAYLLRFVTSIGSSSVCASADKAQCNTEPVTNGCVVTYRLLLVARNWIDFLTVLIIPVSISYLAQIYIILKIYRSKKRLNLGLQRFFVNNKRDLLSNFVIMPLVYCCFIAPVVLLPLFGTFYDGILNHEMENEKFTFYRFISVMGYQLYFVITFVFGLVYNAKFRLKLIWLFNKCREKKPMSTRNLPINNNSPDTLL